MCVRRSSGLCTVIGRVCGDCVVFSGVGNGVVGVGDCEVDGFSLLVCMWLVDVGVDLVVGVVGTSVSVLTLLRAGCGVVRCAGVWLVYVRPR